MRSSTSATPVTPARKGRRSVRWLLGVNLGLAGLAVVALLLAIAGPLAAAEPAAAAAAAATSAVPADVRMWGFMAAAISTAIGALGAAYAVGHVGSAALGVMGERPEIAGRALIFVGLAEGIAIYGLIISIMILARLG